MNVMKEAHKATKEFFASVSSTGLRYAAVLKIKLRVFHKMAKSLIPQTESEKLKAHFIAQCEKRIEELKEIARTVGTEWIVVCGDEHPMPINFESNTDNFWASVETATRWKSRQSAAANAAKVVNGNKQVGKAVLLIDHINWDINAQLKLIKDLKGE